MSTLFFNSYIFTSVIPVIYGGWRAYVNAAASTEIGYGVVTDSSDNVYLAGASGAVVANVFSSDQTSTLSVPINSAFIAKYNSDGIVQWRSFVDVAAGVEVGYATAVDNNTSDVYLVGENGTVISNIFNSDRTLFSNTVFVNTSFIVKYNSSGFGIWRAYIGNNVDGKAYSVKVDQNSNVYVAGVSGTAGPVLFNSDGTSSGLSIPVQSAYLVKYHSNGFVNWRAYVDVAASTEIGRGIAITSSNVYFAGQSGAVVANVFSSSATSTLSVPINSAFLVQYDSSGAVNWRAYIDAAASVDIAYGVAVDSIGNVYLCGVNGSVAATIFNSSGVSSGLTVPINSAYLVKYNSLGNVLWRSYVDSGGQAEIAWAVAVDSDDNVYISGTNQLNTATQIFNSNIYGTSFANVYISLQTAFLVKYDSTGKYIWNSQVDAQNAASSDIGYSIATDSKKNVYLVGTNAVAANIYNSSSIISPLALPAASAFLVKYNSDGFINDERNFKRWPSADIPFASWTGSVPSFTYTMTGQAYGNGVYNVTSSPPSATNYDMRQVFDNSQTHITSIAYFRNTVPTFLQVQFPTAVIINVYVIFPLMTGGAFTAWTFDGSNDGSAWTALDTRSGLDITNKGSGWSSYVFNTTAYSYYRLNFTAGSGYVRNWRMYETGTNNIQWEFPPVAFTGSTGGSNTYSLSVTTSPYINGTYNARSGPNIWSTFNPALAFDKTRGIANGNMWGTNTATYSSGTGLYSTSLATGATGGVQTTAGVNGEWLEIQIPRSIKIYKYSLTGRIIGNGEQQNPSAWTLFGSNNGTTWTNIDSRSGITSWYFISSQNLEFIINSSVEYSYFRIVVTAIQSFGSNTSAAIVEWAIFSTT